MEKTERESGGSKERWPAFLLSSTRSSAQLPINRSNAGEGIQPGSPTDVNCRRRTYFGSLLALTCLWQWGSLGISFQELWTQRQQATRTLSTFPLSQLAATLPPPSPVHPLLKRVMVSISCFWDVKRLSYLERDLVGISQWRSSRVDICIGTNEPDLFRTSFQDPYLGRLNSSGNIHICPLPGGPLSDNALLNWRTRQLLQFGYEDTTANYTSFIFLEDDLLPTWEALEAWAEDTDLLEPRGLKRSFFRVELLPDSGITVHQDFMVPWSPLSFKHVVIPSGAGGADRRFWQLETISYTGVFVATRAQLGRYIKSKEWSDTTADTTWGDAGVREHASWGLQRFEVSYIEQTLLLVCLSFDYYYIVAVVLLLLLLARLLLLLLLCCCSCPHTYYF